MFFGNILGGIEKTIGNFFTPAPLKRMLEMKRRLRRIVPAKKFIKTGPVVPPKKFIRTGPVIPPWRKRIFEGPYTPLSHLERQKRELVSRRNELREKVNHLERKVYALKHEVSSRPIPMPVSPTTSTSIRSESKGKSSFLIPLLAVAGGIVIFMMLRR